MSYWPSVIASILVVCVGILTLTLATDYGQAWTAEAARRLAILKSPVVLPQASFINQKGKITKLNSQSNSQNSLLIKQPLLIMEFIYTRCPTVCIAMGAEFNYLQNYLITSGLKDQVKLLSISFDPNDNLDDLNHYLERFSGIPSIWSVVKFKREKQLETVIRKLGVIVIPEPQVGFIHNAAVYVIKQGIVVAILEHNDRRGIDKAIKQHLVVL